MSTINPQLEKVIDDFALTTFRGGKNSPLYHSLIAAVTSSPVLNERLNSAAAKSYLTELAVNQNRSAGASYNADHTRISLNLNMLHTQDLQKALVFQLAHEIQHGFFHYEQGGKEVERHTVREIEQIAASGKAAKDYTAPIGTMLHTDRDNEALAMIAGWNAVVSYEQARRQTSQLSLHEIVDPAFAYEKYFLEKQPYDLYVRSRGSQGAVIAAAGLKFKPDMTLADDQKAILAQTYFDQPGREAQLGAYGDSDYRNSYAGRYIAFAIQEHYGRDPSAKFVIDMQGLGLDERMIERNGLDLGAENRREAYYEPARPNTPLYFDHTQSGTHAYTHVPIVAAQPQDDIDRLLELGASGDVKAFFKANRELAERSPETSRLF